MDSKKTGTVTLLAAAIGGSAVVTMGALAMGIHQQPARRGERRRRQDDHGGDATVSGKDDTVEATSMAVPVIKGPAPLPAEEQAAE